MIWCDEDTAKLLRSAGAANVVEGRRAMPDERRKSLEAIVDDVVMFPCGEIRVVGLRVLKFRE